MTSLIALQVKMKVLVGDIAFSHLSCPIVAVATTPEKQENIKNHIPILCENRENCKA